MVSIDEPSNAYVLLHHVMGELLGSRGSWGFVEGGMGKVSEILKESALDKGVEIRCNTNVSEILVND